MSNAVDILTQEKILHVIKELEQNYFFNLNQEARNGKK